MDKSSSAPRSPLLSRRRVFAGAGTAGALAAAAVALPLPLSQRAPADTTTAESVANDDAQGRYQLTAHVQRYYQTTKV